jgi:hypothetical protein
MISAPEFVSERTRPKVVSALGKLRLLAGILVTGVGLFLASSTSGYLKFMGESPSDYASQEELAYVAGFIGVIFMVEGIIGIIIGLGILGGKIWAWSANVIFSSLLVALTALDITLGEAREIVGLIFNTFILAYMFTSPVKLYFRRIGHASQTAAPPSSPAIA